MKRSAVVLGLLVLLAPGCQEPPQTARMDDMVAGLAHLTQWHPHMMGKGQLSFDAIMGYGPDMYPVLIDHLLDETPTAIFDEMSRRNPMVCDVVLLMLLELTHRKWEDFNNDGLFIASTLGNPVFGIKWDRTAKIRVQNHFRQLLENPDQK
jgi:hypothetical protein